MSLTVEGKKCPICQGYLFNDDEIVWCPDCGAPHHKDCYKAIGKCGYFDIHNTKEIEELLKEKEPEQSVKDNEVKSDTDQSNVPSVRCQSCGTVYKIDNEVCPNCSAPNVAKGGKVYVFDLLGGVKPDTDLGEGVTADKAKNFVMLSTNRFIPKFVSIKKGSIFSFNLFALLFPTANFAARKMFKAAAFSAMLEIAAKLLMLPLGNMVNELGLNEYAVFEEYVASGMSTQFLVFFALSAFGIMLYFATKITLAIIFDNLYYKYTIKSVKKIESEMLSDEEKIYEYRKRGGFSIVWFMLTVVALSYLPGILYNVILNF